MYIATVSEVNNMYHIKVPFIRRTCRIYFVASFLFWSFPSIAHVYFGRVQREPTAYQLGIIHPSIHPSIYCTPFYDSVCGWTYYGVFIFVASPGKNTNLWLSRCHNKWILSKYLVDAFGSVLGVFFFRGGGLNFAKFFWEKFGQIFLKKNLFPLNFLFSWHYLHFFHFLDVKKLKNKINK